MVDNDFLQTLELGDDFFEKDIFKDENPRRNRKGSTESVLEKVLNEKDSS